MKDDCWMYEQLRRRRDEKLPLGVRADEEEEG